MREKEIGRSKAMDSVRLQRLVDVCDTKENTAIYLLEEWNYEPQVSFSFPLSIVRRKSFIIATLIKAFSHFLKTLFTSERRGGDTKSLRLYY